MIIVSIRGGIGNQLFQYAYARKIQQKLVTSVFLANELIPGKGFDLGLKHFNISLPFIEAKKVYQLKEYGKTGLLRRLPPRRRINKIYEKPELFPQNLSFKSGSGAQDVFLAKYHRCGTGLLSLIDNLDIAKHYYLLGYWQSAAIVNSIKNELLPDLTFSSNPGDMTQRIRHKILLTDNAIAMHMRTNWGMLGDGTVDNHHTHRQAILSLDYYREAIIHICQRCADPTLFIFADDVTKARSLMDKISVAVKIVYVEHNKNRQAWEDLLLMSCCKHFIMSNSTFSWWGCWLGMSLHQSTGRIKIMPKNWLGYNSGHLLSCKLEPVSDIVKL